MNFIVVDIFAVGYNSLFLAPLCIHKLASLKLMKGLSRFKIGLNLSKEQGQKKKGAKDCFKSLLHIPIKLLFTRHGV